MGIPQKYNRIIRRELNMHGAWYPLTNTFAVGDFGVITNGLFTRVGNISELGVTWDEKSGPESNLDFSSASVTSVRVQAGLTVSAFSEAAVEAEVKFRFAHKGTFVLKATLTSREMDNVFGVANVLHKHPSWRPRYRFVKTIYTADNPVILISRYNDTEVAIKGEARLLKQLDLGTLAAGLGVAANKQLALDLDGKSGTVGLGLARVRVMGGPGLAMGALKDNAQLRIEEDTDWDDDPDDDI